jgi:cobalt/nickel transport system permease protein
VVLAAAAFVLEYAIGGTGGAPIGTVLAAMVGVHTLIGIGEGIITALTVGVVLGVRPDLVHGASDLQAPLALGPKPGPAGRGGELICTLGSCACS